MKLKLLSISLFLTCLTAISQTKKEEEVKEFFWGANDPYKDMTEIPEKWANESAVIIVRNLNHDYHNFIKNVKYARSTRERIKLLDKAAVEVFSEFTFNSDVKSSKGFSLWNFDPTSIVGLKVIKPDGTEREIDIKADAVNVDGKTNLAISNLEVGDILDYYSYKETPYSWYNYVNFDVNEVVLAEEYPIMNYRFYLETENDFFVSFQPLNGAPGLKQIKTDKNNFRKYEMTAQDLEKRDFPLWFYPMVAMPSYKFHVVYASRGKFEKEAADFIPEDEDIIKNSVSQEEVLEYYSDILEPYNKDKDVLDYLEDNGITGDAEKAKAAYYYMRHHYFSRYIEASYLSEADIVGYPFEYYKHVYIYDGTYEFIKAYTSLLKELEIDYDIVVGKMRYDGPLDELLLRKNINLLVRANTQPVVYAAPFGPHTSINEFSADMEGAEVYLLSSSKRKIDEIKKGKLPVSTAADNISFSEMTVEVNDDFSMLSINTTNSLNGNQKREAQTDKMFYKDYVYEDYKKYGTESFLETVRKKKDRARIEKEMDALAIKIKEKQKEHFEKMAAASLDIPEVENYDFRILETGRYGADEFFKFSESYDAKDALIKKAGPNYILEIGKLIGGQVDLDEKARKRTEDVYMDYPRTYKNRIVLNIPEGYSLTGIENLKMAVDNATGSFKSEARLEGNTLVVEASKEYKLNYVPNENWPKMIEFLDLANQFTNEKVLLKKT